MWIHAIVGLRLLEYSSLNAINSDQGFAGELQNFRLLGFSGCKVKEDQILCREWHLDFDIGCLSVPVWCASQLILKFPNLPIHGEMTNGRSISIISEKGYLPVLRSG